MLSSRRHYVISVVIISLCDVIFDMHILNLFIYLFVHLSSRTHIIYIYLFVYLFVIRNIAAKGDEGGEILHNISTCVILDFKELGIVHCSQKMMDQMKLYIGTYVPRDSLP